MVVAPPVADRAGAIAALLVPGVVTAVDLGTVPAPVDAPVPPEEAARPVLSAADFDPTKVLLHVDAQTQAAQVDVVLTPTGAQRLAAYTTAHVGNYLGFVVDGRLVAAPRVAAPIPGGSLEIALTNADGRATPRPRVALRAAPLRPGGRRALNHRSETQVQ